MKKKILGLILGCLIVVAMLLSACGGTAAISEDQEITVLITNREY